MSEVKKCSNAMNLITRPMLAGAVAVTALSAIDAQAAIYLKLDGIAGESTSKDHKGEIEIAAFSFGLSAEYKFSQGGGATRTSAPACQGISASKQLDKASPPIADAVMTGKAIKSAVFSFTLNRGDVGEETYYNVTLTDVLVSNFQQQGSDNGGVMDNVTFIPRTVELKYSPIDPRGQLGQPVTARLDCANVKF